MGEHVDGDVVRRVGRRHFAVPAGNLPMLDGYDATPDDAVPDRLKALADVATRRDRAAAARDRAADARDAATTAADAERDADVVTVLARAAKLRRAAARDREMAARDRRAAACDRDVAARELAAEGTDQLTGALRRHVGLAAFNRELERALRHDVPVTLAYVDVDGLKHVNDTYGHDAGDALLRHIVGTIREGLRRYDVITRVGGDEFAVLLPGQDLLGARARFAEINARLAHAEHHPQFSVGFALWRRGRESLGQLIARADQQLLETRSTTTATIDGKAPRYA